MAPVDRSELDTQNELGDVALFPTPHRVERLWRGGEIAELNRPLLRTKVPLALLCGVVGGLLGWFAVGVGFGDFLAWCAMTLAVFLVLHGLSEFWRAVKFSPSRLRPQRERYRPGEIFRATLHSHTRLRACDKIEFTLQYIGQVTVYPEPGLGARRDAPQTISIEVHNKSFEIDRAHLPAGELPMPLDIEIPIPDDPGATTVLSGEWKYAWRLTLRAQIPGMDYHSEFLLPIFDDESA